MRARFGEVAHERILSGTVWINSDTGKHVGARARLHFLLEDLYPAIFRSLLRSGERQLSLGGRRTLWAIGAAGLVLACGVGGARAHAFPERSEPRVGATLRTAPPAVRIWFDGNLEPAFSRVRVTNGAGQQVDRGDSQVDPQNRRLLQVSLASLAPGKYKVTWSVLAVDGHRTDGDYTFSLQGPE